MKALLFFPAVSCLGLLSSSVALAIVDFNQNGLSDIWEKHYNHGVLFPSAFDPNLDPDGDGMSSLLEATAGTDPFNPNPPYGIVATTLEKQPAMMMPGDLFSSPYLRPAMMKMSWQTILGKRYWLQHSDNLLASGWSEPAYFSTGDGSIADSFSPLTDWNHSPINRRFMRVKIDDVDDDGDQLTNYEEGLLGSDTAEGDTDGDLVGDGDEMIRFFTNPLTAFDLDEDGILDDFEKLRASQILAINSDSVFWGNYYQGLAQGNLDGTFDYFYTSVPTLSWLGGGDSHGLPFSVESRPLTVNVSNFMQNAPVRFTISDGDGLLSLDGVQGWSPSVTVHSDSFWDNLQGIPRRVAQVYLRHGSVPGEQSTITALAQAGDQTVTLQTTATVASPDLAPPTDFTATPLAEDTVLLAWVPGIVTEPTTIQISRDLGVSWETHTVVAAGIAELLVQNLIPDREVSFRAFTAGTPTAASRFTSTFRVATAATSAPTPNATATPVTSPQLSSNVDSLWNTFNQNDPRAANWSFSVGYFYQKNSILDQKIPFARNRNIFGLPKASYHWKVNAKRGQVLNWLEVAQPWPNLLNIRPHFVRAMSWVDTTGASRTPDYLIEPDIHSPGGPYLWTQTYLALLPVDLDIEYTSQAGIKTLDDSKEDVDDGGYISLKSQTHQGEDITPTTYLVIRPTAGLPADGKVRLKFNSGGRYKVARDRLGNDPIVSEVTEFPVGQETRLYLVGETKSQSRGGEQITMQISNNGSWIDGDSLKATVVQTQFQIDLRVFIPYDWVNIPHPAHVFQVAKGDSRSYDPDLNGTYRVAQRAIVNLYREWVPEVENRMIENWKSAGVSEHYSNSDVLNWDDGAKHSDDTDVSPSYINSGAAVINSGTADISTVDSFIESAGPTGSSDDTKTFMIFTGAAAEPIIAGAADIDWRIFVGISKNDPLNPQFVMQGVHDGFPAYEIYINSNHQIFQHTNVLQWKPNPSVGVLELIGFPDVTVGTATGLIEQ